MNGVFLMTREQQILTRVLLILLTTCVTAVYAEEHRATILGNPATRFADPLQTPEDLRKTLRSEALRADVEFIARQSGYLGSLSDLLAAAAEAPIHELRIPVGTRMPAMSTRRGDKAVLLRNVLWAGKAPIEAYEMFFTSASRRYRLVCPKPCSNFWVEDLGVQPRPALALSCDAPAEVLLRRPAKVCLNLRNTGDGHESLALLQLAVPPGATLIPSGDGGTVRDGVLVWEIPDLAPGAGVQRCATLVLPEPGTLHFSSNAGGKSAGVVEALCESRVVGVPAVLLEVVDQVDPIEVGQEETYEIRVLNQGSVGLTQVKLVGTLEETQRFVSGSGSTAVRGEGRELTLETLPVLKVGDTASWKVIVKSESAGDVRFTVVLSCDQIPQPVHENESTRQY